VPTQLAKRDIEVTLRVRLPWRGWLKDGSIDEAKSITHANTESEVTLSVRRQQAARRLRYARWAWFRW